MEAYLIATGSSKKEELFDFVSVARFLKKKAIIKGFFEINKSNCRNTAIFVGTTAATFFRWNNFIRQYVRGGMRKVNPGEFPKILISHLASYLSIELGIKGVNCTFSSGVSAGWDAFSAGLHFLRKKKENQLLVLDLSERVQNCLKTVETRAFFCLLKNYSSLTQKKYLAVLSSELFFEKAGENQGLVKAIKAALSVCGLDIKQVGYFFGSRAPGSDGHKLEQEALAYFSKNIKTSLIPGEIRDYSSEYFPSGLSSLDKMIRSGHFQNHNRSGKEGLFAIIISLGCNSNSSCVILRR